MLNTHRAALVAAIEEYVAERGQSARWFGWIVARDVQLVANIKRGRYIRPHILAALNRRLGNAATDNAPTLQPGTVVRFDCGRRGELTGEVRGTREFRSGLWVAIMMGQGFDIDVVRVRASAVLFEVVPEQERAQVPLAA